MSVASINSNPFGTSSSTGVEGTSNHHRHGMPAKVLSAVADKLGMSSQDLKSQLDSGKSLADVAKAKGLSRDDLVATIKSALSSAGTTDGSTTAASASGGTTSTTGTASTTGPSLDDIANKIADHVERSHHHRHHESQATTTPTTSTSQSAEAALFGLGGAVDTSA